MKHNGGKPPLGYNVNAETRLLEINEIEAVAVKMIFELFDKGYGYTEIIQKLKDKALKTKLGNDFKKNSLHDLLKNEKYRACFQYDLRSGRNPYSKRNNHAYKTEGVTRIENGCPRIISDELFYRVQDRMAMNRTSTGKYKAKENYILSGKIICGECGSNLSGCRRHSGRNKKLYITYKCNGCECTTKEINKVYIENFVLSQIKSLLFNKNHIDKLVEEVNKYATANNTNFDIKIKDCMNQISGINTKVQNILTAIEDGIPKASYGNRIEELEASKVLLQEEIKALEVQRDIHICIKISFDFIFIVCIIKINLRSINIFFNYSFFRIFNYCFRKYILVPSEINVPMAINWFYTTIIYIVSFKPRDCLFKTVAGFS